MNHPTHGFETTVLGQNSNALTINQGDSPFLEVEEESRLLLISNSLNNASDVDNVGKVNSKKDTRKKRNRKKVSFKKSVKCLGKEYPVNMGSSGLYEEILVRLIDQLEVVSQKWKRVFVLRFDLHSHYYSGNNERVSRFRDRIFKRIKREYNCKQIGFCWVRELETAKAQHYHWVIFLDGNLIRHSSRINQIIKEGWEDETGSYHVPRIKNPYYFGSADEILEKVIYRVSYLAKVRGKGYRNPQSKDYQTSRMKV